MFEVYLNDKRELLVVRKGSPIPLIAARLKWRRKKTVLRVSNEIRSAVQRHGYYVRKLSDAKNASLRPVSLRDGTLPRSYRQDGSGIVYRAGRLF
jgi:hypothetical protein